MATISDADVALMLGVLSSAVQNGSHSFGIQAGIDSGLQPSEFVRVPHGSTVALRSCPGPDPSANSREIANRIAVNTLACAKSDAARVGALDIPSGLKPFVLASRACSYANGWVSAESEVASSSTNALTPDDVKLVKEAMAVAPGKGLLPSYVTTLLYYITGHNCGGGILPANMLKAVRTGWGIPSDLAVTDQQLTRAIYLAGHASSKRLLVGMIFPGVPYTELRQDATYFPVWSPGKDQWSRIRCEAFPATLHPVANLATALTYLSSVGLLGIHTAPSAALTLSSALKEIGGKHHRFHPGSKYLFNKRQKTLKILDRVKSHLGKVLNFFLYAEIAPTLIQPEHMRTLASLNPDTIWQAFGRAFSRETGIGEEETAAVLTAVSGIPEITNPTENIGSYHAGCRRIFESLFPGQQYTGGSTGFFQGDESIGTGGGGESVGGARSEVDDDGGNNGEGDEDDDDNTGGGGGDVQMVPSSSSSGSASSSSGENPSTPKGSKKRPTGGGTDSGKKSKKAKSP